MGPETARNQNRNRIRRRPSAGDPRNPARRARPTPSREDLRRHLRDLLRRGGGAVAQQVRRLDFEGAGGRWGGRWGEVWGRGRKQCGVKKKNLWSLKTLCLAAGFADSKIVLSLWLQGDGTGTRNLLPFWWPSKPSKKASPKPRGTQLLL